MESVKRIRRTESRKGFLLQKQKARLTPKRLDFEGSSSNSSNSSSEEPDDTPSKRSRLDTPTSRPEIKLSKGNSPPCGQIRSMSIFTANASPSANKPTAPVSPVTRIGKPQMQPRLLFDKPHSPVAGPSSQLLDKPNDAEQLSPLTHSSRPPMQSRLLFDKPTDAARTPPSPLARPIPSSLLFEKPNQVTRTPTHTPPSPLSRPPTQSRLFLSKPIDESRTPPSPVGHASRFPIHSRIDRRNHSAPLFAGVHTPQTPVARVSRRCATEGGGARKRSITANVNPFTPTSLNICSTLKRQNQFARTKQIQPQGWFTPTSNGSFNAPPSTPIPSSTLNSSLEKLISNSDPLMDDDDDEELNPSKRMRVSEINISRYQEEFLELQDIATGEYGQVKVARHRLDGMVYAIKVTRSEIVGSQRERAAMNEVFAHAALMKHKHIVRYYNSWVEKGKIYIQNEYCEGGSLARNIKERREEERPFSENEIRRIAANLAKGLNYIHSKQLVHLDIKPENIFLSLDHLPCVPSDNDEEEPEPAPEPAPQQPDESEPAELIKLTSTDSGNSSDNKSFAANTTSSSGGDSNTTDKISYKIGDLGHVAQINGDYIPEEGDCRYMAPEMLLHDVDRETLPKADVFSLGLTLYECATLKDMPKNSMDDPLYEKIRLGNIPPAPGYSKEFNQLIKLMTSPDVMSRPSTSRIMSHPFVKNGAKNRGNVETVKELRKAKEMLRKLQAIIDKEQQPKKILVGKGAKKSLSNFC